VVTTIYTIGFTQTTAEHFFGRLREAGVQRLMDVRLNNSSTLAGFSKRDDLAFFLHEILGANYLHVPLLAPTDDLLGRYRKKELAWDAYAEAYLALLDERDIASVIERPVFATSTVLLCSEPTADRCHRRLVAEYLSRAWGDVEIVHL
jgi:uncharacterized protein (DUF488 family)